MSKRSQEKRKARSKEKKLARRREQGVSPLSRLVGTAEETCECWMHYAPEDDRTRSLVAFRPLRGGGFVMASFLIDMDCLGVKDAWWRKDIEPAAVRMRMQEQSRSDGSRFVKVTLESAEAGGGGDTVDAEPSVPAAGGYAGGGTGAWGGMDVEGADVSEFGTEEGLFYAGLEKDLERALLGVTVDEFLEREDVDFEFYDDEGGFDADFEVDLDADFQAGGFEEEHERSEKERETFAMADEMVRLAEEEARHWCEQNGVAPAAALQHAAFMHVASILASISAIHEGKAGKEAEEFRKQTIMDALDKFDSEEEDLMNAIHQVRNSGAKDADALVLRAIDRMKVSGTIVDVAAEKVLTTEQPCSTQDTPSLPNSSSTTPVP